MDGSSMMMFESPYLRWWFTVVFALPGLYFLARCLLRGTVATRIGDVLHVLMCAGMIVMVSPAGMAVPVAAHLVVFAGGTLWFAGLFFVEHGNRDWHQVCAAHAHHAIMMAGMVWMAMIMALGGHGSAVPRPIAIVAVVFAVLFLVGGGAVMILSSRTTSVPTRRRDPDEDFLLLQCVEPAPGGGDSFILDAYRFVDEHATPELREFLTGADVDLYGQWAEIRGVPATPRVARHVEYTRTGRRIVRNTDGSTPMHRDPDAGHITRMLETVTEAVCQLQPQLPRFRPEAGEILVVDNYRCWHGRDAHTGGRMVRILTVRTADAR